MSADAAEEVTLGDRPLNDVLVPDEAGFVAAVAL
jgi:hypothetical protein